MLTVFAAALGACGLDYGQAAKLLNVTRSTIQKKCSLDKDGTPALPMTAKDARVLGDLHKRIRLGALEDEKQRSVHLAAAALRVLRGDDVIPELPVGRPAKPKVPKPKPKPESVRMLEDFLATVSEEFDGRD